MARAATTTDAFNAVAEPRRRQILELLAGGERSVTEIADVVRLDQPSTSKHLRVLRQVGAVHVRGQGRLRVYRLDPVALQPMAEWLATLERLWTERFESLDDVLAQLKEEGRHGEDDEARHGDPAR